MEFYILKKRPHLGPLSIGRLDEMLQEEAITGEDLYWHEGMDAWLPLARFAGFIPPPASPPPPPAYIVQRLPSAFAIKPPGAENAGAGNATTAKIRTEEARPPGAIKRSAEKVSTQRLGRDEKRPPTSGKPSRANAVLRASLVGILLLAVASGGYSLVHHYSDNLRKPSVSVPRSIDTVGDALRFACGTWTYTGTESDGAPAKPTLWEKLVINLNGTIDMYSAFSSDKSWGIPKTERFKIVIGRYEGTRERVFGLQVADHDMKIILTNRGTLREITAERDVEFSRGEKFPFSM